MQQINVTGNLDWEEQTVMYFIIKEAKEFISIFDLFFFIIEEAKEIVSVVDLFWFNIILIWNDTI